MAAVNPFVDGDRVQWQDGTYEGVVDSPEGSHPTGPGDVLVPVKCTVDNSAYIDGTQKQTQVGVWISVWWEALTLS